MIKEENALIYSKDHGQKMKEQTLLERLKKRERLMLESGYYAWITVDKGTAILKKIKPGKIPREIIEKFNA